jgi:flagellin-specific chaperone FliS
MARQTATPKSAIDILIDSFMRLRAEAKERMSAEEFQQAEEKFNELATRIRARRQIKQDN